MFKTSLWLSDENISGRKPYRTIALYLSLAYFDYFLNDNYKWRELKDCKYV